MRLTIFGATGGTGRQLLEQALAAGHQVTVLVRDPARLPLRHQRLHVVTGDVLDPRAVQAAVTDADAVASVLGARASDDPCQLFDTGMGNIVDAMREAGVRRLAVVSAQPVVPAHPRDTLVYRLATRPLLWRLFGRSYKGLARMEQTVRDSGLDWTIVRPGRLTNGPGSGHYRISVDGGARARDSIPRADLAAALLRALDHPGSVRTAFLVAA